jgi:uncharacterized damage-inducible protein DinB
MSETRRIKDQLKRAYESGAWHGPAVLEVLEGVSAAQASARPIPKAHSIWEIVLHMATWKSVVARRLGGEPVKQVPEKVDWPPVETADNEGWRRALAGLQSAHEELRKALDEVQDDELDESPYSGASTRYVLLHGAIQHDLYHAGQIAVLKKE